MADITVYNHGSVVAFRPATADVRALVEDIVAFESWQWLGGSLMVDPRFASGLVEHLESYDLEVDW